VRSDFGHGAEKLPKVRDHLDAARADLLAFTACAKEIWRQLWSNNPNEQLNMEIRRRTDVVGIVPDATPSPTSSAPSSPSNTTSGSRAAASSPWTASPTPAYGRPAPSPTTSTTTGGQPPTNRSLSNPANSPSNPYPQLEGSRSRFTTPGNLTQLGAKRSCRCIPLNQRSTTFGIL
jgi:hypothetical protein